MSEREPFTYTRVWPCAGRDRLVTGRKLGGRRTAKPGAPARVRGVGAGRKTRRSLERGGTGAAGELNEAVGGWPRVKITPMFGRWSYFVGPRLFGCFPLREKDRDLWIRLAPEDQRRALATAGVVPHRRLASSGWVESTVETTRDVGRAIRWLRRAYQAAVVAVEREERR